MLKPTGKPNCIMAAKFGFRVAYSWYNPDFSCIDSLGAVRRGMMYSHESINMEINPKLI